MLTHEVSRQFLSKSVGFVAIFLCCQGSHGQANEKPRIQPSYSQVSRKPDLSELAEDNYSRVAASSVQIRAVLLMDAGLLVELKRWVAKEATDNGQIVEDQSLTDQAIFDRLDRDQAFRSVATRLVQRYGYLMPKPNPDSDLAKQQDLILKERVKRFVALEAEQDNQLLHPENNDKKTEEIERTATCDPQREGPCEKEGPSNASPDHQLQIEPQIPETNPSLPLLPPDLSPLSSQPRTLRSSSRGDEADQGDRSTFSSLELTSGMASSGSGMSGMLGNGPMSPSIADLMASRGNSTLADRYDAEARSNNVPAQSFRPKRSRARRPTDEDTEPVKMIRPANPYSDIPSI
jgi:hypothetical protein